MMRDPEFLTVKDVELLHGMQLVRFGGGEGLRSPDGLESAVAMPHATFSGNYLHGDLFSMAAAYAFHVAQGQTFMDGNKRIGLAAALVFLDLNGISVADSGERLYDAMIGFAERRLDKDGMAAILRELVQA